MAASVFGMNGLWRRMAIVLVLCALLLSNEVMCQDDPATDAPAIPADVSTVVDAAAPDAAPDATSAQSADAFPTVAVSGDSAASVAPDSPLLATTLINVLGNELVGDATDITATPVIIENDDSAISNIVRKVVPDVMCVGKEDVSETNAVKAVMSTNDCETTKRIIEENPAGWCSKEKCNLKIFQDGYNVLVASDDGNLATLADTLKSEQLKDKLGVTKTETPSSSGSAVFVGILVSGLLAALAITLGYLKCQRRSDTKEVRLAEEAYPADQENQGNTLVSVAPLNPPPETPEKPSVNGESTEAAKTEPSPPTNGHSTTKTADTEL